MKKLWVLLLCMVMAFSLAACGSSDDSKADDQTKGYTVDEQATDLTIAGEGQKDAVYTADELKALGETTLTYSGRNKKVENARQFFEYTGVDLKTVLKDAGFDTKNAILKITCSDKYTVEYKVDDLYGLYAYANNESDERTEVIPMIAVVEPDADSEYPAPFKIVFGQADYDTYTNEEQDFNSQGWASYIQYIEISYED
ncbi:MAG: molybdopterin-dependent oxidoreductase [Clostridiales bacterium]|nr:molybdopterin-dependent oxidoreductase [Clostridiales bacterium]